MNSTAPAKIGFALFTLMGIFCGCSDINSSWENNGGGYLKYTVNGEGPYTIELAKNDVEPPFYVNNSHHYFYFCTNIEESERGDQFSLMVTNPHNTGKDLTPVTRASINERYQYVTWMRAQFSPEAPIIPDSSSIRFDEIIDDSLWTAKLNLYFKDCRTGACIDSLPPLHIEGRLRYWVPASER